MLGALCSDSKSGNTFVPKLGLDVSIGYRFQPSSRHFVGTVEQTQREINHNQIQNTYHLMDVAVNYTFKRQWSVNVSLPILVASRNQLYPPRGTYNVAGIGDMTFGVKRWIFRSPGERGKIQVGLSLKAPTGDSAAKGFALDRTSKPIIAVGRPIHSTGRRRLGLCSRFPGVSPLFLEHNAVLLGQLSLQSRRHQWRADLSYREG